MAAVAVYGVGCPTCGAGVGVKCVDWIGGSMDVIHHARSNAVLDHQWGSGGTSDDRG